MAGRLCICFYVSSGQGAHARRLLLPGEKHFGTSAVMRANVEIIINIVSLPDCTHLLIIVNYDQCYF